MVVAKPLFPKEDVYVGVDYERYPCFDCASDMGRH